MVDKHFLEQAQATFSSPNDMRIEIPLVVDLDGTLIKTDLLYETANQFVCRHPLSVPYIILQLAGGKGRLKAYLAEQSDINPTSLPYNGGVMEWIYKERKAGRKIVLATGSDEKLAQVIAKHLCCFDEVLASNFETNLVAGRKRDLLVEKFGDKGFDYLGNDYADRPVWKSARTAHAVAASKSQERWMQKQVNKGKVFYNERPPFIGCMISALRPHQWIKNLLVFVPLLTAHAYSSSASVVLAFLAFLTFNLTASSVYVLNDLADVNDDRHHLGKRKRPFAAGDLSLVTGWLYWPVLLCIAYVLSLSLPMNFLYALAAYYLVTFSYSFYVKTQPVLDVLTLAGLYTLRIIAGAAAISVPLSFWLLLFSMFVFLSLAFIKRFSELESVMETVDGTKILRGRGYIEDDFKLISMMGISAGYIAVVVLALYIQDEKVAEYYANPKLIWLACPLQLYWISRAWLIAHRGEMHDDPIVFAMKDKVSWFIGLCFVVLFGMARYGV